MSTTSGIAIADRYCHEYLTGNTDPVCKTYRYDVVDQDWQSGTIGEPVTNVDSHVPNNQQGRAYQQ